MKLNRHETIKYKNYEYSCLENQYLDFLKLSGYLCSGEPLTSGLNNLYNQFTTFSQPLVSYNYIKYGLFSNHNNLTLYQNTDSSFNKVTITNSESEDINGLYLGTTSPNTNGKFEYNKSNKRIFWSGDRWVLTSGGRLVYESVSNVEYPWLASWSGSGSHCCFNDGIFSSTSVFTPNKFLNLQIYSGKGFFNLKIPPTGITTGIFLSGQLKTLNYGFSPCIQNKIPLIINYSGRAGAGWFHTGKVDQPILYTQNCPLGPGNEIVKTQLNSNTDYNFILSGMINLKNGINFTISNPNILPIDILTGNPNSSFYFTPTSIYDANCYFTGQVSGSGESFVNLIKSQCIAEDQAENLKLSGINAISCDNCDYTFSMSLPCPHNSINHFDVDSLSYFQRASIIDFRIKEDINTFIINLKNLKMWDKFKNIFILRSDYNNNGSFFYDLKNPNFTGTSVSTEKTISGYKFLFQSSRLNFPNHPINLTGANFTIFSILENYTSPPPNTPYRVLLSSEVYQTNGFRFGTQGSLGNIKQFNIWSTESVSTSGPVGFNVSTSDINIPNKYSFLTAGVLNSGSGFIQINNNLPLISGGEYIENSLSITSIPKIAGGTTPLNNRISFFAISNEDLTRYHKDLHHLASSTIARNIDIQTGIDLGPVSSGLTNVFKPIIFQTGFSEKQNFINAYENSLSKALNDACNNCYYLITGEFYTGDQKRNLYNWSNEYCNVTGSAIYKYGEDQLGIERLKGNLLNNVINKSNLVKCLEDDPGCCEDVGCETAYIGFGGSTGSGKEKHEILAFSFQNIYEIRSYNKDFYLRDLILIGSSYISGDNNADENSIVLTDDLFNQGGNFYFRQPFKLRSCDDKLPAPFKIYFQMRMTPGQDVGIGRADGISLIIQSKSDTAGGIGGGIGYFGIDKSIAVSFDTYKNDFDINNNHIELNLNGIVDNPRRVGIPSLDLADGQIKHVWVDYLEGYLKVYISNNNIKPSNPVLERDGMNFCEIFDGRCSGFL